MSTSLKKNAVLNTIKTLCQVIFPIITIPYISRALGAVNYGKVNYTASIISYFALFAAFGINNYATREGARIRDDKDNLKELASQLYTISIITSIISILTLLAVVFGLFSDNDKRILLLVQGAAIIFTALGADWVNTIYEDFKYITIRYIVVHLVSLLLLFIFVKTPDDFVVYAAILTIANSGANLFNIFYIKKYVLLRPQISSGITRHIRPMLILVGYSFALTIYVNSDTTLLGIFKGDADVGIYSIAAKIYLVVKQVLNASIMVSVPRIASYLGKGDKESYKKLLSSVFDFLLLLVLPSMVGLFMMSDEVVFLAGGAEYTAASLPLKILSVALCFAVFGCYFSNCYLLPNKLDKEMFIATIAGCVVNIGLNCIVIPKYSYIGTAGTTLLAEMIVIIICIIKSRNVEKVTVNTRNMVSVLAGCVSIVAVCIIFKLSINQLIIRTIGSILISALGYVFVLIMLKNSVAENYLNKIIKKIRH